MEWLDLFAWVQTVTPDMLPPEFAHNYGVVVDPAKWLAAVQGDAQNKDCPRARYGALHGDLRRVWDLCN